VHIVFYNGKNHVFRLNITDVGFVGPCFSGIGKFRLFLLN
jgi:hypothetical protein